MSFAPFLPHPTHFVLAPSLVQISDTSHAGFDCLCSIKLFSNDNHFTTAPQKAFYAKTSKQEHPSIYILTTQKSRMYFVWRNIKFGFSLSRKVVLKNAFCIV